VKHGATYQKWGVGEVAVQPDSDALRIALPNGAYITFVLHTEDPDSIRLSGFREESIGLYHKGDDMYLHVPAKENHGT